MGREAIVLPCDIADADRVENAAARAERELGPIGVWVNNAMNSVFAHFWDTRPAEFRRVTEVTYLGYVHGTMAALKRMRPRNEGVIVQVGSALAYRGIPLQSAYCGAKHAIQGFTDSLRCELEHEGSKIKVPMVQLPALNTPQFLWSEAKLPNTPQPVPPIFQPEVAAKAIYWAATHPNTREPNVTWKTWLAINGDKLGPRFADWYLARTGFESQQTEEPLSPGRPSNLWDPLDHDRDYGAHGPFDARAKPRSLWWSAREHWKPLLAGVLAAGTAGTLLRRME
jgi:NAD(P)-dependent dehydrogenase (short-subunit alcohol dehydrogenase family)